MSAGPSRRRILLVTNWIGWAGAERQLEHLAAGLSRAGHSVRLLAIGGIYADTAPLEAAGVELTTLGARSRLAKLRAVAAIRRCARSADVVPCTGWDATLWGRLGALAARRPVVVTEHSGGREIQVASAGGRAGAATIAMHNRLLDRVTYATIAVGTSQRRLLEQEGVRAESIVHIPNGVPIEELRRVAEAGPYRVTLGIPEDALIVVQVARFNAGKRQRTTLHAMGALRERLGDVRVLFVGDGGDEERVRQEAAEIGATWAMFLGFRSDVASLLQVADLSVLPSMSEGLPMSLIEAAAVGTPIVASDVGDIGWFLETTGAGISVPAGDDRAFAEACEKLLGDPALRARMGESALRSAAEFDAGRMVRRYEEVFEAAIELAPLPLRLSG
jgi:glycosyltransferase involved in cell wall biosynthesis